MDVLECNKIDVGILHKSSQTIRTSLEVIIYDCSWIVNGIYASPISLLEWLYVITLDILQNLIIYLGFFWVILRVLESLLKNGEGHRLIIFTFLL